MSCEGLRSLARLKELRTLNLFETDTDDDVLNELQGAVQLTELSVGTFPHNGPKFTIEALVRSAKCVFVCRIRAIPHSPMFRWGNLFCPSYDSLDEATSF